MLVSSYPCHTTSPNDKSCIFVVNNGDVRPVVLDKRISCLTKDMWCCYGDNIAKLNGNFNVIKSYSNKYFNQLHSVFVDNSHYVCSTGLDLLLELKNGKIINSWHPDHGNSLSWLSDKDYRGINYHNIGVNKHHVNHVFKSDGKIYVCCGKTHKYYELSTDLKTNKLLNLNIAYSGGNIMHDGLKLDDNVFFTETTGLIHKWNIKTGSITSKDIGIKWIRGLSIKENGFCVGSSSVNSKACLVYLDKDFNVKNKIFINKPPIKNPQLYSIII